MPRRRRRDPLLATEPCDRPHLRQTLATVPAEGDDSNLIEMSSVDGAPAAAPTGAPAGAPSASELSSTKVKPAKQLLKPHEVDDVVDRVMKECERPHPVMYHNSL